MPCRREPLAPAPGQHRPSWLWLLPAEADVPQFLPGTHQEPSPKQQKPYSCPDLLPKGHTGPPSACQSQTQPVSRPTGQKVQRLPLSSFGLLGRNVLGS